MSNYSISKDLQFYSHLGRSQVFLTLYCKQNESFVSPLQTYYFSVQLVLFRCTDEKFSSCLCDLFSYFHICDLSEITHAKIAFTNPEEIK